VIKQDFVGFAERLQATNKVVIEKSVKIC